MPKLNEKTTFLKSTQHSINMNNLEKTDSHKENPN